MKLQKSYFSNRFATVLNKAAAAKTARKSRPIATTEMEALESRILLSGIGTGLNKRNVTFFDADGDKVQVNIQAAPGAKNVSFNIDLGGATNNADAANITINGNGSLGIVVTPVGSFTRPLIPGISAKTVVTGGVPTFVSGVMPTWNLTPGYTNVGSITAAAGVTTVGSIGLSAAVVADINLGAANAGNINLNTGRVAAIDNLMANSGATIDANTGAITPTSKWAPGLGNIDMFDVTAGSIGGINI